MEKVVSLLFVEDHHLVRYSIKYVLQQQSYTRFTITEAVNGTDGYRAFEKREYDVILLDINLPDTDGVNLLRRMLTAKRLSKVLILSSCTDLSIIRQALALGAHGYLLKACSPEELVKAILLVAKGEKYYCNEAAQAILGIRQKLSLTPTGFTEVLTKREVQILALIAREMSNLEIAELTRLSIRTIEGHRRKIRSKLNIKTASGLMKYAVENNYQHKIA